MSTKKLGVWVSALMTRFEEQLPCRNGPQTHHTRINTQQNKESIIHISKWKFTLVISGLTKILTKINEMRPHPQVPFNNVNIKYGLRHCLPMTCV